VSVLSLVLTNKRNLMLQKTLEQLMMIKIQGPSLPELDWEAAAVLFFSKKRRRAKVDDKYTKGKVSGYKWGDVYGVESKSEDGEELLEEAKEVEAQELARGESDGEAPMSKATESGREEEEESSTEGETCSGESSKEGQERWHQGAHLLRAEPERFQIRQRGKGAGEERTETGAKREERGRQGCVRRA
jgi:hypothetical protein